MAEGATGYFKKIYLTELASRIEDYEWEHLLGKTYDGIVPISGRDEGMIAAKAKKKKRKLPPMLTSTYGIDPNEIKDLEIKPEYPSVFFLGALDWLPNQEGVRWFVDNVWGTLHARYPEVKFYVAGRKMANSFLADKDATTGIIKVGEVENAQKFMQEKGIMVAPLLSGSGIRIKIIEGMMMGKPIVASDIALEGNPAEHVHHIYRANSPSEFLEGVSLLIEKEGYGLALGKKAKAFATHFFDEKTITDKLITFYDKLKK
jgi:glycosyltransferase involved in cell wall biosynthesis